MVACRKPKTREAAEGSSPSAGAGTGPAPEEAVEARRQAGPSSGQRGDAADGGARCAWPLLVNGEAEDEASKDAKTAPDRGGGRPRASTRRHERPYNPRQLK